MTRIRLVPGQAPHVAPPLHWGRTGVGYGDAHVRHWRRPEELRRCAHSACLVFITTEPECSSCGQPTVVLAEEGA